jgi:hypothetical protein
LYPKSCDDSLSWNQVQTNLFKLFVGWKIKMNLQKIQYAQSIYHRLHNKSFRRTEETIDILLNEFNFSEDKVNGFIFNFNYYFNLSFVNRLEGILI